MLRLTLVSPALAANCYALAAERGRGCVVVDPGYAVGDDVNAVLTQHDLTPEAILITHGHVDHTASAPALAAKHDVPVYVHVDDAPQLTDPLGALPPEMSQMLSPLADGWRAPDDVRHISGPTSELSIAGLRIVAIHAPGHTPGSTLYHVPGGGVLLTGDVLFAGTIGRTDLPGGDDGQMAATLQWLATTDASGGLPDDVSVLPGHGEASTLGRERAANPYLTHRPF